MSEEKIEMDKTVEWELYDFMQDPAFMEMESAVQYVDFFMTVKQDCLVKLDSVNLLILNTERAIKNSESDELLNVNFKEVYGKDNDSIRKAHLNKVNSELLAVLDQVRYDKSVLLNQIDILNDMISANKLLIKADSCNCGE